MKNAIIKLISISLWIIIITLIIISYFISIVLGISLTIFTILVHAYIIGKNSTDPLQQPFAGSHDNTLNGSAIMSQDYFDQISRVVEDLMLHYNYACRSIKFREYLDHSGIRFDMNNLPLQDIKQKVRILFWLDLVHCYKGLGHSINLKEKTGFGLLYFTARSRGISPLSFSQISTITTPKFYRLTEDALKTLSENIPDIFLVAHLFGEFDEKRKQQYLVLLYRFASITAKADNMVTPEEAQWLSSMMQFQSSGDHTKIIENEDEIDDTESVTTKRYVTKRPPAEIELKNLIGLESVKQEVDALTNYIKIQKTREEKGMKTSPISYHCVFTGNPGTGKTTVARILARIYKNLGVVTKGHLVETDRSGLVAEYVGQTAVKTNKIIDSALDGVLFIDEAYSLIASNENDYGKEAIATLLKRMEDDRDRLIVILAGYSKEMKNFIDSNPGLQSRFNRYIEFPDYNAENLYQIFCKQLNQFEYTMSKDAAEALKSYLEYQVKNKDQNFGNARFVRNLFERTIQQQANRLSKEVNLNTEKLSEIIKEDIPIVL